MRYYPTLWILADIDFKYIEIDGVKSDFKFNTRYPPHISLACVAVQLDVDKVGKLEQNKISLKPQTKSPSPSRSSSNSVSQKSHSPHTIHQKQGNYTPTCNDTNNQSPSIQSADSNPSQVSTYKDTNTNSNTHQLHSVSTDNSDRHQTGHNDNDEGLSIVDDESGEECKEGYAEDTKTK